MCQASKLAEDWVVKGCHIHIEEVELVLFPDHLGGVGFRAFFSKRNSAASVAHALKVAWERCLPNPDVRKGWIKMIKGAQALMGNYDGALSDLARGRMLEFKFLLIAIERWGAEHGDA